MSWVLKIVLVAVSVLTCIYTLRKIKKSQFRIEDALFWIVISVGLVVISIFPGLADFFAGLIGVISPTNFIYLVMIFLLLIKSFSLSLKISQLEEKQKNLVQQIAIKNLETEKEFEELNEKINT